MISNLRVFYFTLVIMTKLHLQLILHPATLVMNGFRNKTKVLSQRSNGIDKEMSFVLKFNDHKFPSHS